MYKRIAPVMIPTMCRYEHFLRLIESLKKNTWAKYTDVYVGLDYPPSEKYLEGYNKIKEYLDHDFDEFNKFIVLERKINYGSEKNSSDLRRYIFQRYDRLIRTDDDCEFSPYFLEYMNKALIKYEGNDDVVAVTGYSYPVDWVIDNNCTAILTNAIFPMWGTGYLKKDYLTMENEILTDCFNKFLKRNLIKKKKMTTARWIEVIGSLYSSNKEDLMHKPSDMSFGSYIQITEKSIVTPKDTLVINHGFDGSGVYCQDNSKNSKNEKKAMTYNFHLQSMPSINEFHLTVDEKSNFKKNRDVIDSFDKRSYKLQIKTLIKYLLLLWA